MLRQLDHPHARRRGSRVVAVVGAVLTALFLSGCDARMKWGNGLLLDSTSTGGTRVTDLWVGVWIAALAVGGLVWGLLIWCLIAYRRRKDDDGLPEQLRYNVPIEILYTIVPIFMVATLFYYTSRDQAVLMGTTEEPDHIVNVVAKQWSWDFNYVTEDVYTAGTQATLTGKPGVEETLPTLYLVEGERTEFVLTSRDVIHSFWVPTFQQKLDVVPGRVNRFQVVPTTTGEFQGKCAELCGTYHANMLFNVKIVNKAEFDAHIADLRANGQTGQLPNTLNREKLMDGQTVPTPGSK